MGPLAGIRVVELGQFIGAAYAARLLGDFGAEVVKIETASGGALRAHGPFRDDKPSLDEGGLHLALDGGKRSIVLDLESGEDRSVAERLIGRVTSRAIARTADLAPGVRYDAAVRLRLDVNQLPKPFQVDALASREWQLASEWRRFAFTP